MAKELTAKRYTRQEAEKATADFIQSGCTMRQKLLDLYEREAHVALGYTSFEVYTAQELGAEWKDDYLRQLRMWAKIEREVLVMTNNELTSSLPQKQAFQLTRLPNATLRKEAYDECTVLHTSDSGKVYRSPRFITDLTHIVNRMLKGIEPPKPDSPAAEPEPETPTIPASATPSDAQPEIPVSQTDGTEAGEAWNMPNGSSIEFAESEGEFIGAEVPEPLDWEEGLKTALTWTENQNIDGDKSVRSSVVTVLCAVAEWIAEAK